MSDLWGEIESLVLDGVPMDSVKGWRLAQLTEIALERLLNQRGTPTRLATSVTEGEVEARNEPPATMRLPAEPNEARWAEELALVLYRAMDRTF
jgi:hypothetical protein